MRLQTRKLLDTAFSGSGVLAILVMIAALLFLLIPIFLRGAGAIFFTGTVEHRRLMLEKFGRGDPDKIAEEVASAQAARMPVYLAMDHFEQWLSGRDGAEKAKYRRALKDFQKELHLLLGPAPGDVRPILARDQYGQTRWDRAQIKLFSVLYRETWDYSRPTEGGILVHKPRREEFSGTPLEEVFPYIEENLEKMLRPCRTVYWQFLTDNSLDAHFFGGIWPEIVGTFYLTLGAMIMAVPMGVIAAIYLTEYARASRLLDLLRTCISTLAGVPSIVFGLFGLAFFINTMKISHSKSVLVGSMTLALMILPTIIRASEEALRAVPRTYKEAALSLGAGRWYAIRSVLLPSALPGILTGIVISMGRAAGETAPIIFTAAVSVGQPLALWQTFTQPTPALSWSIYNLATEHEAVDAVRHVQYGLVFVLIGLVLVMNLAAVILRAHMARRVRA